MSTYSITLGALKKLACIEFRRQCESGLLPHTGAQVKAQLDIGASRAQLVRVHGIDESVAHNLLIAAWAAEGQAVIERLDARSTASLLNAIPTVVPMKYRNAAITHLAPTGSDWTLRLNSDTPRIVPSDAPRDGYELICRLRTPDVLRENVKQRAALMAQAYASRSLPSKPNAEPPAAIENEADWDRMAPT